MSLTKRAFATIIGLLLAATLSFAGSKDTNDKKATHESKEVKQVREVELAFAAAARSKDYEKTMSFWDEDVHFFVQGKMSTGMAEQRKNWEFLKNPDLTITWTPEVVEASGGMGYTTGPYEIHVKQKDGSERVNRGRYVTFWHRKPDGSWKAALDIGSPEPPPAKK